MTPIFVKSAATTPARCCRGRGRGRAAADAGKKTAPRQRGRCIEGEEAAFAKDYWFVFGAGIGFAGEVGGAGWIGGGVKLGAGAIRVAAGGVTSLEAVWLPSCLVPKAMTRTTSTKRAPMTHPHVEL